MDLRHTPWLTWWGNRVAHQKEDPLEIVPNFTGNVFREHGVYFTVGSCMIRTVEVKNCSIISDVQRSGILNGIWVGVRPPFEGFIYWAEHRDEMV